MMKISKALYPDHLITFLHIYREHKTSNIWSEHRIWRFIKKRLGTYFPKAGFTFLVILLKIKIVALIKSLSQKLKKKIKSNKDQTKRLQLKERGDTGVQVKDLLSFVVKSVSEIEHVMNVGNQNRSVRATNMNDHSSRSHAIFTIYIECSNQVRKKLKLPRKLTHFSGCSWR